MLGGVGVLVELRRRSTALPGSPSATSDSMSDHVGANIVRRSKCPARSSSHGCVASGTNGSRPVESVWFTGDPSPCPLPEGKGKTFLKKVRRETAAGSDIATIYYYNGDGQKRSISSTSQFNGLIPKGNPAVRRTPGTLA